MKGKENEQENENRRDRRRKREGKPPPIDWAFFPTSAFNWHSPVARRGANLHGRELLYSRKGCFATKGVDTGDLSFRDAKNGILLSAHRADIGPLRRDPTLKFGAIYRVSNSHDGSSDITKRPFAHERFIEFYGPLILANI